MRTRQVVPENSARFVVLVPYAWSKLPGFAEDFPIAGVSLWLEFSPD